MTAAELHALESAACPGAGACGGQFTANTMAGALDFLGISPAALSGIPATHERKADAAVAAGRLVMDVVRRDLRPSQLITRDALENAAACVAATGGSTNGVLHLLAIARELGIEFTLDDFERVAARTPIVASLKPGGRFVATDMYEAGGIGLVARELQKRDLIHAGAHSVDGGTLGDLAARAEETPGQEVVVPIEHPIKPTGGLAILYGNLAPEGCVVKLSGHERTHPPRPRARLRLRGGLLRGRQGAHAAEGRRRLHPLRGPRRRPRHARDAARHRRDRRRGPRRGRRADHRRALLRRHARLHGRARRTRGRARRPARGPARGRHRHDRRRRAGAARGALRRRDRRAPAQRQGAAAALHDRRVREVRGARQLGQRRRDHAPDAGLHQTRITGWR